MMIAVLPEIEEMAGYELKVLCDQYKRHLMDREHFIKDFKAWKKRNGIEVVFDHYFNQSRV